MDIIGCKMALAVHTIYAAVVKYLILTIDSLTNNRGPFPRSNRSMLMAIIGQ